MAKKVISRRNFIKAAATAAGAGLLAACAPATVEVVQTQIVKETVESVVKETSIVKETQIVSQVVTATPAPTAVPEPAVMEVWWNTDIPDFQALKDGWKQDPDNEFFKKNWNWGGLAVAKFGPFIEAHPGVGMNITSHSWDSELRQNQLMGLAAGIIPDTTYGEAYVNEFVQLGVFAPISDEKAAMIAPASIKGAQFGGKSFGIPKSSGADVLFINLDKVIAAGMDPAAPPTTWEELVALAQAISAVNKSDKYGNTAYYTYGPDPNTYGTAMRILHWFDQNDAPLATDGVPSANLAKSVDTWDFHNQIMWTSTENLILQAESEAGSGALFNDGTIALKPGWNNDATSVGAGNVNALAVQFPIPPGGHQSTIVIGNDIESPLLRAKNTDLGIALIEETGTNEDAQAWLANNAGIWIPALNSLLEQYATYDRLGGYATDTAKTMVRVTMQTLLESAGQGVPGWPKNGSRIWAEWNNAYLNIWKGKLAPADIKTELDKLQTTIEGLLVKTG